MVAGTGVTVAISVAFAGDVIPYVRMTRRSKRVNPRAMAYNTNQLEIKARFKEQLIEKGHRTDAFPIFAAGVPLHAHIIIHRSEALHKRDLDNQVKAILDAAEDIIFANDLWIDRITAERSLAAQDRAELVVLRPVAEREEPKPPKTGVEKR